MFLGTLRCAVYLLIGFIFLLPAKQLWEKSEKRSRVLVMVDVSPSITNISDDRTDDLAPGTKKTTRLERIINTLTDDKIALLKNLLAKNPVSIYRFGGRSDDEAAVISDPAKLMTKDQWADFAKFNWRPWILDGLSDEGRALVEKTTAFTQEGPGTGEWALGWAKLPENEVFPTALNPTDKETLTRKYKTISDRVEIARQITDGTNVGGSVLTVLNREANNMLQGIVVFSDGRSSRGSDSTISELRTRAERDGIPMFMVAVGEDRPKVEIRITDVQAPNLTPPDEAFKVYVEADGEGLPGQVVPVTLEFMSPDQKEPIHTMQGQITFSPGEPPHGQAEFVIDPLKMPEIMKSKDTMFREFIEGEWKIRARIPKDKRETFDGKEHVSEPETKVSILKAPLRVLMMANGPNRDFQFLRTLILREKDRAELSIWLKNEGGKKGEIVQDVDQSRLLSSFPTRLNVTPDPKEAPEDKYYNLAQYDVILAFDPDWSTISREQFLMLEKWVDKGGGFILIAGPVCTSQLARAEDLNRLQPLLDLLPIVPGDNVLASIRRSTKNPWRLTFPGVNPETDFLRLDDDIEGPLAGWESFFTGKEKPTEPISTEVPPQRGFYSFYPVNEVKAGANTVARFTDPDARGPDRKDQPFLITNQVKQGRSMFLGSSEIWRLRQYKISYYERFWVKLMRYAAAGSRKKQDRRGRLLMSKEFSSKSFIRLSAQLLDSSLQPVPESLFPKMSIQRVGTDPQTNKDYPKKPYTLVAKKSADEWTGMFQRQILAESSDYPPGDYKLEVEIPDSSDMLTETFRIRDTNPELDNTRPDLLAMAEMAGEVEEVSKRIENRAIFDELRRELKRNDNSKLLFKLSDSRALELIPECMMTETRTNRNRGPVEDLWDKGPTLPTSATSWFSTTPVQISTFLLIIVGLLSIEWLTRKLLRLA